MYVCVWVCVYAYGDWIGRTKQTKMRKILARLFVFIYIHIFWVVHAVVVLLVVIVSVVVMVSAVVVVVVVVNRTTGLFNRHGSCRCH